MVVKVHTTYTDFEEANIKDQPYMRANRSDDLVLTDQWQRIDLNGSSSLNANTHADSETTGVKKVDWDTTNSLITFNAGYTHFHEIVITYTVSGGFRPAELDLRFVIPGGAGVNGDQPIYFPLPDSLQHISLANIERRIDDSGTYQQIIRTTSVVRDFGIGVELRSNQSIPANQPTLNDIVIEVYPL